MPAVRLGGNVIGRIVMGRIVVSLPTASGPIQEEQQDNNNPADGPTNNLTNSF